MAIKTLIYVAMQEEAQGIIDQFNFLDTENDLLSAKLYTSDILQNIHLLVAKKDPKSPVTQV
jgi:hypothetical protein